MFDDTKSYSEKLQDPRWQRKRLEVLERDGFECKYCGSTEKTLMVHHLCYFKGLEPWDYHEIYLLTLCWECHDIFHDDQSLSEYFLTKRIENLEMKLDHFDEQESYDIGGILRFYGERGIVIPTKHFTICKVERKFNKEEGSISFTITEEDW